MGSVHELGQPDFTRDNLIDHLYRHAYYGVGTVISTASDRASIGLPVPLDQRLGKLAGLAMSRSGPRHSRGRRQPELYG